MAGGASRAEALAKPDLQNAEFRKTQSSGDQRRSRIRMAKKVYRFLAGGLRQGEVRERIYRILGIASLLVAIGGSVILVVAFMLRMQVLVVALSGILSMALAFYLFVKLWPKDERDDVVDRRVARVKTAIQAKNAPPELSPEEYRRQRQKAQQMIAKKAAPALAKAIQSILHQAREEGPVRKVRRNLT